MNQKLGELTNAERAVLRAFFTRAFHAEQNHDSGFEGASETIEYFCSGMEEVELDIWSRALRKLGVKGMMTRDGEVS